MDDTERVSRMQLTNVIEDAWFGFVLALLFLCTNAGGGWLFLYTNAGGGWWELFPLEVSDPFLCFFVFSQDHSNLNFISGHAASRALKMICSCKLPVHPPTTVNTLVGTTSMSDTAPIVSIKSLAKSQRPWKVLMSSAFKVLAMLFFF